MEWALDANKQHVHASSPNANKGKSYLCPRCKKDAFLRKGKKRIPHFAHVSGQTNINCELYIPPVIYASQVEGNKPEDIPIKKFLELYINVIEKRWTLDIKIPFTLGQNNGNVSLKIPFAWEGERTVPLNSIQTNGKRVRIRLQSHDYRILINGQIDAEWKRRLEQPVRGLDDIIPTIFHYSRLSGRRVTENQPLQWGMSYVLVWSNNTMRLLQNLPVNLAFSKLQDQGNWSGVLLKLPDFYDNYVEQWVEKYLSRSTVYSLPEIKLVTPIPERQNDQEANVISPTTDVVIAIVGQGGSKRWSEISIGSLEDKKRIRHLGNGENPILLSIGKLPLGKTDIWLDDDVDRALRLICIDSTKNIQKIKGVVFRGINKVGCEESCSLHSADAKKFFKKMQLNKLRLTDIDLPDGVDLKIKVSGNQSVEWIVKTDGVESFEKKASLLNELLRQDSQCVYIDAGGFGKLDISPIDLTDEKRLSMRPKWRKQMKWIISMLQSQNKHEEVMVQLEIDKKAYEFKTHNLDYQDQALLQKLLRVHLIPISMLPYVRSSIHEYLGAMTVKQYDLSWD
ncbi:competence protein CoiA family protein [Cohnella cellulosilytica]|uniref:Competence protein CoiA family protein n=1 Tax=Cohnella cellulosilytica TaxID=986710 RepID=A0ABW2F6Z1_9BACL